MKGRGHLKTRDPTGKGVNAKAEKLKMKCSDSQIQKQRRLFTLPGKARMQRGISAATRRCSCHWCHLTVTKVWLLAFTFVLMNHLPRAAESFLVPILCVKPFEIRTLPTWKPLKHTAQITERILSIKNIYHSAREATSIIESLNFWRGSVIFLT